MMLAAAVWICCRGPIEYCKVICDVLNLPCDSADVPVLVLPISAVGEV